MIFKFCLFILMLHGATALLGYNKLPVKFYQSGASSSSEEVMCAISSVDYPDEDKKFSRYVVPPIQIPYAAWVALGNDSDFEECSENAYIADARMFYFDDGLCKISNDQYYRLTSDKNCSEPEGAVVYVLEDLPVNLFEGRYSYRSEVTERYEVFPSCIVNYTTSITDNHTIIKTMDYESVSNCQNELSDVFFGEITGEYVLTWLTNTYHKEQGQTCAAINMTTCAPKTEENRVRFIQEIADLFDNAQLLDRYVILDLAAYGTSPRQWVWATGVIEPDDSAEWAPNEPYGDPYNYGFHDLYAGLYSWYNSDSAKYYICCSRPKIDYDVSAYMLFQ